MSNNRVSKILLSKETFCKALQMIREQREIDAQFSKALELVGEGYFLYGAKNLYHDCLLMVLKEAINDSRIKANNYEGSVMHGGARYRR